MQQLPHGFSVTIERAFERSTSCNSELARSTKVHSVPNRRFHLTCWNTCFSHKKLSVLDGPSHRTLFTCEIWVSFHWRTFANQNFRVEKATLFLIALLSCIEKTHGSRERKPSVLEAGSSGTLFPCENRVNIWKEYFQPIIDLRCTKAHFTPNRTI